MRVSKESEIEFEKNCSTNKKKKPLTALPSASEQSSETFNISEPVCIHLSEINSITIIVSSANIFRLFIEVS